MHVQYLQAALAMQLQYQAYIEEIREEFTTAYSCKMHDHFFACDGA